MTASVPRRRSASAVTPGREYHGLRSQVAELLSSARHASARAVNVVLTATYWQIGRVIVEYEQKGGRRAGYGEELLSRLAVDLTRDFGRGFSADSLERMRLFYRAYPPSTISATLLRKSTEEGSELPISVAPLRRSHHGAGPTMQQVAACFPLPWTAYVRLLSLRDIHARAFYEAEALRGGWSVRQLERQIDSMFYERTALSRNKAAMLRKGMVAMRGDRMSPEEEIKDPYVLEFLNLKDEYSESDLEEALIRHMETFLLELGDDFAFVSRQKRLRIGTEWYRVDLVFFNRRLRCLVIVDLKTGRFTHADAGQMHLYLNYARQNWCIEGENPPVGLILCAEKDDTLVRYALDALPNKVLAAQYRTFLPDAARIEKELVQTRRAFESHRRRSARGR